MMWKDKYAVGVELIDEQHKELFRRVSDFTQIIRSNENWNDKLEKVKETMSFMQEYVIVHFHDEEIYQEQINYPDIEAHKEAHSKFREGINNYVRLFKEEGFTEEKVQEFGGKLMTWLIMHVGKIDQKIGEYAKSKEG
ncbi:hemerythrin [Proteiniborus sp. DW1]|uniref:bacteriohemerythrin n=1 Tax=Proteiniborus sp. DW1 TaxID=1889883 RepID=UPI00092E0975|nr:hemerythrin family protein [Proteiniborus sp. DW1]SCG81714.1 hemerythrin [Proteiniborus sp. DW1]